MKKNKAWQLYPIIILFAVPLCLAWLMHTHSPFKKTVNRGHLFTQAIPLKNESIKLENGKPISTILQGKWNLILFSQHDCGMQCQKMLYKLSRARLILGKKTQRVRVHVVTSNEHATPELTQIVEKTQKTVSHIRVSANDYNKFKSLAKKRQSDPVLLVDPLANVLMSYDNQFTIKAIYSDLQRLLQVSHIG